MKLTQGFDGGQRIKKFGEFAVFGELTELKKVS
jgi:hypothetical protein